MNKPDPESVCEEIMELLLKDGFSYQVPMVEIEKVIWKVRGTDKRTVRQWTKVLVGLTYLKQVNRAIFEMNVARVPGLFKILKNQPQTHLTVSTHTQSSKKK